MKILVIDPFFAGSHRKWALEYQRFSQHEVEILSLSGHHWKWRMHGGAITLARRFLENVSQPDLILATGMLDLNTFLSLTRKITYNIPTVVYFHENQLTYPRSERDQDRLLKRDVHYSFINVASALSADRVLFNSQYHQDGFLGALPDFLRRFPDHHELSMVDHIAAKSQVLPIGLDLADLDIHPYVEKSNKIPLILWNHRWEYDKGPDDFFRALIMLSEQGAVFQLAVLGEQFANYPGIFDVARNKLKEHTVKWGYAEHVDEYRAWLCKADMLPVTSVHDYFGISVVEALYCNTYPLLPANKVYEEYLPRNEVPQFFYHSFGDLMKSLSNLLENTAKLRNIDTRRWVEKFDWAKLVDHYDQLFAYLAS